MKRKFIAGLTLVQLLLLSTSASATTAVRGNMVLDITHGAWDGFRLMRPWVLNQGPLWVMWYTGESASGIGHIGFATSQDGTLWTKFAQNPILSPGSPGDWDEGAVRESCVVYDRGEYKMWFTGEKTKPDKTVSWAIGYATSPDGIRWTKYSQNPVLTPSPKSWDSLHVWRPSVIVTESGYVMYYRGVGVGTEGAKGGAATSSDGVHWTKTSSFTMPAGSSGWDTYSRQLGALNIGNVVIAGGGFIMVYSSLKTQNPQRNQIGLAGSADGTSWAPYLDNPVITYGGTGWDSGGVGAGTFGGSMLLIFNNQYYVYYAAASGLSGEDARSPYRIGLSILPPLLGPTSTTTGQTTVSYSASLRTTSSSATNLPSPTVSSTQTTSSVASNEAIYLGSTVVLGLALVVALLAYVRARRRSRST